MTVMTRQMVLDQSREGNEVRLATYDQAQTFGFKPLITALKKALDLQLSAATGWRAYCTTVQRCGNI